MAYSEFADPVVAESTLNFLNLNKRKILSSYPDLLVQVWRSFCYADLNKETIFWILLFTNLFT